MPLEQVLPLTTDCSGFATLCYFVAGAPDPNGLGYSGAGWTGTMLRHMGSVEPSEARRGDLVVWGAYPGRHVAILIERGDDPLLCSHGSERGPIAIRYSEECRYQPALVTWLTSAS
jgi:cell wall-associated NlpC family hydrolase